MNVTAAYEVALRSGSHQRDPAQAAAVTRLGALQRRLETDVGATLWSRWGSRIFRIGPRPPVTGLYLWGGVGRGKTWLMDLFHDTLEVRGKRRVHFHRFMREVHASLKSVAGAHDPLRIVADGIARDTRVLCFDELFVSDIGDAMILGTLLGALFERGVTLVATSNLPPRDLYRDGLQRARFLPAIAALEAHCEVHHVGDGTDFRLRALQQAPLYVLSTGQDADRRLSALFERVAAQPGGAATLEVDGRPLPALRVADGVAWFSFGRLCGEPRGASDYIELAKSFHTVIVSGVPVLDMSLENEARRLVTMVDEFYDRRVKLVLSAAAAPDRLYTGERLRFEFERTASRLTEMQSEHYLRAAHLG